MDGILGCDSAGKIMIFNQSIGILTGRSSEEVIGRMTLEQFFEPGAMKSMKDALVDDDYGGSQRLFLYESAMLDYSGRAIPVQLSAAVIPEEGEPPGLVLFIRDLREIRRLEREMMDQARILHQDKMMSLGRLAASVAHEINNPLSGILNYLRLMMEMLRRGEPNRIELDKFTQFLELIESETARCSRIVSGLLTFSRKSPPEVTDVKVVELLKRCLLLARHKLELQGITSSVNCPQDLPPVRGDFNELQQCVINLIFNAMDAMPNGGRLDLDGVHHPESGFVLVVVKDSGSGIHDEHVPHIFEPFFTTKKEGAGVGLGLSTIFGIVERHGGKITVETEPEHGTAFTLWLPAV